MFQPSALTILKWFAFVVITTFLLLCLHHDLVEGGVPEPDFRKHNCHDVYNVYEKPHIHITSPAKGTGSRWVGANHKTGTFLGHCLCRNMHDITDCKMDGQHTRGDHIVETNWGVNFVRDPYTLVVSGYFYHRNTTEVWARHRYGAVDANGHLTMNKEARIALAVYENWCYPFKSPLHLNENTTYEYALHVLPMEYGLVLESIRTLVKVLPNMMAAARRCAEAETAAKRDNPRNGGCKNAALDDFMLNYTEAWKNLVAPAFNMNESMRLELADYFNKECNPFASNADVLTINNQKTSDHISTRGDSRTYAMTLIRRVDAQFLHFVLYNLNVELRPLLSREWMRNMHTFEEAL